MRYIYIYIYAYLYIYISIYIYIYIYSIYRLTYREREREGIRIGLGDLVFRVELKRILGPHRASCRHFGMLGSGHTGMGVSVDDINPAFP